MRTTKLFFLCGKMAAGKSTQARLLAQRQNAVLLAQDELLEALYPGVIVDIATFMECSRRLKAALSPHIRTLLLKGVSVVLDFPGNTLAQRSWFRELLDGTEADHELHFIDVSDEVCKVQLKARSKGLPAGSRWTSEADFDAITTFFQPPAAEEGFNVIRHRRT
jgi:predicted kinase